MNKTEIAQKLDEYKQWHEHQMWAESVGEIGYIKRDKALKLEIEKELATDGLRIVQEQGEFNIKE